MVATNAFGLGIEQINVRLLFIIICPRHPGSLLSGAGRSRARWSTCWLYPCSTRHRILL